MMVYVQKRKTFIKFASFASVKSAFACCVRNLRSFRSADDAGGSICCGPLPPLHIPLEHLLQLIRNNPELDCHRTGCIGKSLAILSRLDSDIRDLLEVGWFHRGVAALELLLYLLSGSWSTGSIESCVLFANIQHLRLEFD